MSVLSRLLPHTELSGIRAPTAPGLCLAFGTWTAPQDWPAPILLHAAGKGETPERAALSCLGEMAENLSIGSAAHRSDDLSLEHVSGEPFALNPQHALVRDLANPDDLGSEGCAAGETIEAAIEAAICERFERAAVYDWWTGSQRASPIAESWIDAVGLRQHDMRLRQGYARISRFFLAGHALPIPTVIALTEGAEGIALGYVAATNLAAAARRALEEAILQEVPLLTAQGKDNAEVSNEEGRAAARSAHVATASAKLFDLAPFDPPAKETRFEEALRQGDLRIGYINLTHKTVGVPVVRAIIPDVPYCRPLMFSGGAGPL